MWPQPLPSTDCLLLDNKVYQMFCSTARTSCKIETKEINNGIITCVWCSHGVSGNSGIHLLCDIRMKDNCKRKLAELNIPPIQSSQFIANIFGQIHGTKKQKGLIDATTGEEFDTKLQTCQEDIWTKRHLNAGCTSLPTFARKRRPWSPRRQLTFGAWRGWDIHSFPTTKMLKVECLRKPVGSQSS